MKISILLIIYIYLGISSANGQVSGNLVGLSLPGLQKLLHNTILLPPLLDKKSQGNRPLTRQEKLQLSKNNNRQMPLVYAYKDLAFFCKLEVKMEQTVSMPVKFRLGSTDYVDWLEGKRDNY